MRQVASSGHASRGGEALHARAEIGRRLGDGVARRFRHVPARSGLELAADLRQRGRHASQLLARGAGLPLAAARLSPRIVILA